MANTNEGWLLLEICNELVNISEKEICRRYLFPKQIVLHNGDQYFVEFNWTLPFNIQCLWHVIRWPVICSWLNIEYKQRQQLGRGEGSKIWSKLTTNSSTKVPTWGKGVSKIWKNCQLMDGRISNIHYFFVCVWLQFNKQIPVLFSTKSNTKKYLARLTIW